MRAVNPVLRRELVERWRSRRAPVTLTLYLAVLGAIMYLLYRVGVAMLDAQFGFGVDAASAGPVLGRFLIEGLFFFVLLLVLFVGPGYAAAQISGERERRTLTLLQVTLLGPLQIVLGKLGAAVAWLTLLVTAAVPLGAAAFFLGGFGLVDLLRGGVYLIVIAVAIAAMGLGISSLTKRTTGSIVLTYGLVLTLVLGTFFLSAVEAVFRATRNAHVPTPVALYLNPFFGLADAVNAARPMFFEAGGLPSPLGLLGQALPEARMVDEAMMGGAIAGEVVEAVPVPVEEFESAPLVPGEEPPPVVIAEPDLPPPMVAPDAENFRPGVRPDAGPPVWLIVMLLYLLMGLLGLLVATRRLRVTEPRSRVSATAGSPPRPGAPAPAAAEPGRWERAP
ncbi:MAG TPA: ABC transporter permease [Egibacteraceae bacterium]|nr:ABC transporter permease [Egibacteraceae bacterium]